MIQNYYKKCLTALFLSLSLAFFINLESVLAELTTVSPDFINGPSSIWDINGGNSYNNGVVIFNELDQNIGPNIFFRESSSVISVSSDIKMYSESKNGNVLEDYGVGVFMLLRLKTSDEFHYQVSLEFGHYDLIPRAVIYKVYKNGDNETVDEQRYSGDINFVYDEFYTFSIKLFNQVLLFSINDKEIFTLEYGHNLDAVYSEGYFLGHSNGSPIECEVKNHKITYGEPLATDRLTVNKSNLSLSTDVSETITISGGTGFFITGSSDNNIATARLNGNELIITGKNKGTATITVTDSENNKKQIEVSVIGIHPSSLTLSSNETQTITIDGGTGFYQLSSDDTSVAVATLYDGNIQVTGVSAGTATVTITDSDSNTYQVPVTVLGGASGPLSIDEDTITLTAGDSDILNLSGGTPPYSAESNNQSIATCTVVSDKLSIDAVGQGTATITITDSIKNTLAVNVTVEAIQYLSVDPTTLTIPMLNTAKIEVSGGTGYYQISSTDTKVATYTVTDDTVTVKGESIGTAKIIITDSDGSSVLVPVSVTQKIKAIIVAASGPYTGNHLWNSTLACTQYAYKVLQYQGYTDDTIKFLASDTVLDINGDGLFTEVDGNATSTDLRNAITNWALDAKDVIVYTVGHGSQNSLRIDQNEIVTVTELNTWFNTLEGYIPGKLTFIYDACQSGSFLSSLKPTDTSKKRILIASASLGENAYFTSLGSLSFSNLFWTQIHNGGNIKDSFAIAKNSIEYTYANQTPVLDDNGNGIGNEDEDGMLSQQTFVGNGVISAGDIPAIGSASPNTSLNGETAFVLHADNITDSDTIEKVWAIVTPPDFSTSDPDNPVLTVPTVEMSVTDGTRYEGIYEDFDTTGTYNVAIYAKDSEGNISLPKSLTVTQKTQICDVDIQGYTVSGDQTVNSPVTISVDASSICSDTLYYRFSMHPDYGTSGYDGTRWTQMTTNEYQMSNQCIYTFTEAGEYIVVIWVVADSTQANFEVPIIGFSVDVGADSSCKTTVTGSTISGTQQTGSPVSFTVNANNSCLNTLYYRYSMHPYYGTSWYDGTNWSIMGTADWVSSNTLDYTFEQSGKYVIVVWVSDDTNAETTGIPIAGWSMDIE